MSYSALQELKVQVFQIEWECASCGRRHSFYRELIASDGWPNKFELTCGNEECGQEQDVPFRDCTATPVDQP